MQRIARGALQHAAKKLSEIQGVAALESQQFRPLVTGLVGTKAHGKTGAHAEAYFPGRRAFASASGDPFVNSATPPVPFPILGFIRFVPEKTACVVETFGRFNRVLLAGLNVTIPFIDSVAYTHSLKELTLPVHSQQAITKDNVTIHIDGVLYVKIVDPFKASYGVDNPLFAIMQLAQTTMRSEIGKMSLDNTFEERDTLNHQIVNVINSAAMSWGLECLRYEIKDISPPQSIIRAMELQAEAERRKRAQVLESEGFRQATINESEATREQAINHAKGEAEAITRRAEATAAGIVAVSNAISSRSGLDAVALRLAEQYVEAFGSIAKTGNTMIIPADASNVASMVTQAASVFQTVSRQMSNQNTSRVSWEEKSPTEPRQSGGSPPDEGSTHAHDRETMFKNPVLSTPLKE